MRDDHIPADEQKPYPDDKEGLSPTVTVVNGIKIWSRRPEKPERK